LRQVADGDESGRHSLAYERLAKEGRKFGLSLWVSTQRPSEVSPTVLSQCGTWVTFRLTGEQDLKAVATATEWADRQETNRIAGLPRQQAIVFGSGVPMPVRVQAPTASPTPESKDPDFNSWFGKTEKAKADS
jgi:DNA helicase HerA-like ATPase